MTIQVHYHLYLGYVPCQLDKTYQKSYLYFPVKFQPQNLEQVELQFGNEVSDAREVGLQVFNNFKMIHPDFTFVLDNDLKNNTPVKIYRNHLEQVLIILMDNAVKYSQDRKEVHMSISKNSKLVKGTKLDLVNDEFKFNVKVPLK